jgi:polar amino acid transport system substrate-binding protein
MIVKNLIQKSTDRFVVQETPGLPFVRGNYHQVEQVVINLVTNACQALPAHDRSVAIETGIEAGGEWVILRVIDEGIGIPAENLTRVIDPFFTTRRQAGGSGLGLSVSSRIVQNHGGTMSFTSTVDKGTLVTVRFPASGRAP